MGFTVDYQTDRDVVVIKTRGRLNFKTAQQYSIEATKLAHRNKCNKYLIDHTETELKNGIHKLHTDGDELEQFGFKGKDRLAIVILHAKDDARFSENFSQNKGWSNFRYFDNVKDAFQWLDNV